MSRQRVVTFAGRLGEPAAARRARPRGARRTRRRTSRTRGARRLVEDPDAGWPGRARPSPRARRARSAPPGESGLRRLSRTRGSSTAGGCISTVTSSAPMSWSSGPEGQLVARGEVEERRRQRAPRRAAVVQERSAGRRQLRGRRRQVDRRAVDDVRVAPVAPPVEEGVPGEEEEAPEPADDPDHGVDLAGELELGRVLAGGGGVDPGQRHQQRVVEALVAQQRQHLVLEDPLALLVRQVERPEAGRRVELDLPAHAPAGLRVDVHEDRQAVVEALPAHAPLVDQRDRVRLGRLGRRARLHLRVDDDLGAGALLDRGRSSPRPSAIVVAEKRPAVS